MWHHLHTIIWQNMVILCWGSNIIKKQNLKGMGSTPLIRTTLNMNHICGMQLGPWCGWFWCQYLRILCGPSHWSDILLLFLWTLSPFLNCCLHLVKHPGNYCGSPQSLILPPLFGILTVPTSFSKSSWDGGGVFKSFQGFMLC